MAPKFKGGRKAKTDQVNVRFGDLSVQILDRLVQVWGMSKTGVLERLLREEAQRQGMLAPIPPIKLPQI